MNKENVMRLTNREKQLIKAIRIIREKSPLAFMAYEDEDTGFIGYESQILIAHAIQQGTERRFIEKIVREQGYDFFFRFGKYSNHVKRVGWEEEIDDIQKVYGNEMKKFCKVAYISDRERAKEDFMAYIKIYEEEYRALKQSERNAMQQKPKGLLAQQ